MRDCVFDTKTGTIALAPQQGMKLSHVNGNIVEQVVLDADGKLQTKQLSYDDAMLLRDVLTYDDTNHMLSYMHRILDEGERCVDVSQNRGCVIKVRLDKPSKAEYMKYDQPTYVLTINPQPNNPHNWHLYYYKDAEENEIPLTNDESLQKIKEYLHDLEGRNANQLSPQEVAKLERLLRHYDAQSNGVTISDHTEFDTDDSIMSQRHHEKNPKIDKTNVRQVTSKTATGRPLTEINHFSYHEEISKEQKIDFTVDDTNQSHYFKANDIKITDITVSRTTHGDVQKSAVPPIAKVNNTNDANGNITSTVGALPDSFRSFVVNSENAIVYKTAGNKGKNYYFYAEKRPGKMVLMAYFGDIPDSVRHKLKPADIVKLEQPPVINVDVNHEPLSSQYPPALPSQFTVPSDMTYNQIADELNYTGYGATLAAANGGEPNDLVHAHTTIHIPSLYYEVPETAWNGSMPSIDKIIGGMYPNLPMPTIRMKPPQHADFLELALEAAACAAVMVIAPEALAGVMGYVMAYGIAGAMASAASQGIAMGFGTQHGFDMKAMARDAILSAVSAGLGPKLGVMKGTFDAASLARNVATAEAVALAQQALLLGTGLQKRPNWQQMIAAAFSSTLSTTTSATLGDSIAEASVNTFANSVGDALVTTGRLDMTSIAANTLGSMVGTGLGNVVEDQVSKMALERVQTKVSVAATKPATKIGNAAARTTAEALKRVVETPGVVSDANETGLEMESATYTPLNVPDPTLPLGDTIHSDAVTYELSEMNSQRMNILYRNSTDNFYNPPVEKKDWSIIPGSLFDRVKFGESTSTSSRPALWSSKMSTTSKLITLMPLQTNPLVQKSFELSKISKEDVFFDKLHEGLGIGAIVTGIAEYNHVYGSTWKGSNGKWYSTSWGGNQYTGSIHNSIKMAEKFNLIGKRLFFVDAVIEGKEIIENISSQNYGANLKPIADLSIGAAGTFGGPIGWGVAAAYIAVDLTIGWDKMLDVMNSAGELELAHRKLTGRSLWMMAK